MEKTTVLSEIEELIYEGKEKVLSTKWDFSGTDIIGFGTYVDGDIFYSWRMKTLSFLRLFLPHDHEYAKVFEDLTENDYSNASSCVQTLENIRNYLEKGYISLEEKKEIDVDSILERVFSRFHKVARQLRDRYNNKPTLEIEDEYDVQDLLFCLNCGRVKYLMPQPVSLRCALIEQKQCQYQKNDPEHTVQNRYCDMGFPRSPAHMPPPCCFCSLLHFHDDRKNHRISLHLLP